MDVVLSNFVLVLGFLINAPAMSARSPDATAVAQAVESLRKPRFRKSAASPMRLSSDEVNPSQERDSDVI